MIEEDGYLYRDDALTVAISDVTVSSALNRFRPALAPICEARAVLGVLRILSPSVSHTSKKERTHHLQLGRCKRVA